MTSSDVGEERCPLEDLVGQGAAAGGPGKPAA